MKKRRKREEREKNACILTEGVVIYGSRLRYGPLVKRLRRRPLTAETGVRFFAKKAFWERKQKYFCQFSVLDDGHIQDKNQF